MLLVENRNNSGRVFPLCILSNPCRLMSDPWKGFPPIDPELLALLRSPIKLEPISPPSSPGHFFIEPMTRHKSTSGRVRQPRDNPPRQTSLDKIEVCTEQKCQCLVSRRLFFHETSLGRVPAPTLSGNCSCEHLESSHDPKVLEDLRDPHRNSLSAFA